MRNAPVRSELPEVIRAVHADLARPVVAGFPRVAYAFPEEIALLTDVLNEAAKPMDDKTAWPGQLRHS
jgi:hypothetical protein